jgi:hypothetical protein
MKRFAEDFFRHFGAQVESHGDELVVHLPPDLAEVFGKPRLYLVFAERGKTRDLSPAEDLLVYGSRTFDRMLALLQERGQATQLYFPQRHAVRPGSRRAACMGGEHQAPLSLHNCRIVEDHATPRRDLFYVFNFRAVYVSDEKQEEFITIALDDEGQPRPDAVEMLMDFDANLLPTDQAVPVSADQLRPMLDAAVQVARAQIEARADELEKAIQPRLEKVLLRLSRYYRRLLDEVQSDHPAQDQALRADLQRDLESKTAEELERHQLRVTLTPLSYAVALVPFAQRCLSLATRHSQHVVELGQNLHTGQVTPIACHHCGEALDHLALCDHGHAAHPHCLDTCCRCGRDVCHACGIQPCAICGDAVCADCTARCPHCADRLCASHVQSCAICGQAHCTKHSFRCRCCDQLYCLQHAYKGMCETCRWALVRSATIPAPPALAVLDFARHYRWRQATNANFNIYVGRHFLRGRAVVVTDKEGRVIHWKKWGLLRRLFKRGGDPPLSS